MRYRVSYLMDEIWERAVETALDGQTDPLVTRSLTLDGAVKCVQGRLPPRNLLERFQNLEHLSIANTGVSSLEQFPRLRNLQTLILSDNRIAGGLEFLVQAGLDFLRDLDLSNNRIQFMEDLVPLAQLKLVSLDLYECPVTRVKDYRARVFGLIKSLKYLDKMDAEENERPESEEEDEEDGDEEDDNEEDDPGSCEIDVEERPSRMSNGHSESMEGVVEVDEEEESEADEEETETGRWANGASHQANGFRVEPVNVDDEEDDNEEENESGEEIDEEDGENDDDVVEVHEIEDSDDKEDGVEDEEDEDEDEDVEGVDNDEGDFRGRQKNGLLMRSDGEIDGHEQGEDDDGYDDGETGEEEQGVEDGEEEEEGYGAGYLVQPVTQAVEEDDEDEEEVEDDDEDDEVQAAVPPSSTHLKRKREEDEDSSNGSSDDDGSSSGGDEYSPKRRHQ